MDSISVHRPRNVDWKRAAALLYGDWGTSKAYVIGMAFAAAQFSSFPIILAVCALTGLVGYNYMIVCRHFPDGGGVYSAAREQSRVLAVLGSLLLLADFIVTASLSCWDAMEYFRVPPQYLALATMGMMVVIGGINFFGPKHSGSFAMSLALPMVVVVVGIIALSLPHLTLNNLTPLHAHFGKNWVAFVGVILALSGVEAIANLTGVMKLDPGSTPEKPVISKTATKSIVPVAIEVVFGTALLAWAMLSLPHSLGSDIMAHHDDMLRYLAEHYATANFGPHVGHVFGLVTAVIIGLLLLSATNTAIAAMIGLMYMLARDKEMPTPFTKLNSHGVPWLPMFAAVLLPMVLAGLSDDLDTMADMYAIGVVGAIAVNLGSCVFNKRLKLTHWEWATMMITFVLLFAIEITIAKTKPAALFFAACVLLVGFGLRWYAMKRAGLESVTIRKEMVAAISPESMAGWQIQISAGQSLLVAARGVTPVLRFAMEEARLRSATLYVLYVKELAVTVPGMMPAGPVTRWQDDPSAAAILYPMIELGRENKVTVLPLFAESDDPSATILELSAMLGIDILVLGAPNRSALAHLLKGSVVREVAKNLPENIQVIIHG